MGRGILFVGNFLSASGKNRTYCEEMSDRLEARRWHVIRTSSRTGRVARLLDMIRTTWVSRHDYAVAHVDVFSDAAFAWAEAVCFELRRLGKPYILTLRGGDLPRFSTRWPRRMQRLLTSAAIVTSPSGYLRAAMAGATDEIIELPNAVELSQYPYRCRERPSPRLVWLRAFHEVYNPTMAVEVLARLRDREATLTMIGADKEDGSLETVRRRARDLGVEARLEIIPGVPKLDVGRHLSRADVFLNTTDIDNSPISVLEAMACGLCVISTDAGGIPYLLSHDDDAVVVPVRDVEAMTAAVERVLGDLELSARLSSAARRHAASRDWAPILNRWDELFADVIAHA